MPELLPNTDLPHPPAAPPEAEDGTFLMSEDMAIRLEALDILRRQFFGGRLEAYRGEYVVAAPDGAILGHHPRLKQAEAQATPEAVAKGIPTNQLVHYYVATPD